MAGVLFIIWIPCDKYEEILSNKQIRGEQTTDQVKVNSEDEFNLENLEEELDSQTSVESFVDCEPLKRKQPDEENPDDDAAVKKPAKRGSMDSDTLRRYEKEFSQIVENEAAVDRFFSVNVPPIDERSSMEKVLREIIEKFRIKNSSWVSVNNGNSYQITFSLEKGVRCDDTIHMLSEFGIGQKTGSSIAIIPCTLYSETRHHVKDDEAASTSSHSVFKETAWNKFIGTVRARMNVEKIVVECKESAALTFDFIVLLIVASILASFGLVENSTLFLAASMLISPLMGPILAATFGAVIKDHKLQYWGLRNEIVGIFMCIFVGFLFGLITCGLNYFFPTDPTKTVTGLTQEMITRTDLHSVIVGIFIALPSGAAVAIAVIGENFGSLVGVAISASLLPPTVNTGLIWSFSLVHKLFKETSPQFIEFVNRKYSEDEGLELLTLGVISLCMTLTNVLCVYFMGFVFLKVKEVAPVSDDQRQFWKHDIKIARDYNKTINADEGLKLKAELMQFQSDAGENFKGVGAELLRQNFPHTSTWSPMTLRHHIKDSYNNRTNIRELETIYKSLADKSVTGEIHQRPVGAKSSPRSANSDPCSSSETPKKIIQESTLVQIDGPGTSGSNTKRFTITPAHDPLV